MGALFHIHRRAGNHLSVKRVLFPPVPGLFFIEQPGYCFAGYVDHVHRVVLFAAATDTCPVQNIRLFIRAGNTLDE